MSAYILSNALVYLKDILPITSGVWATFRISRDLERGLDINTGGVNAFFILKSSTQIERYLITAVWGVATIVKRGLEQDGITENANLQKSWGDGSVGYITVKPDDFIALGKLDTSGGFRNTMGTAKNIGATNGSTAITVANTSWWANGATITGTGIPGGTTIVSFVPNTSAVLSANFTWTTGTLSVIVWMRYALEIDNTLNEVEKIIGNGSTISSIETIRKRKADGTYEEIAYSVLQADMTLAGGGYPSITPYESSIVSWNPVGMTNDGLIKATTENKSSANVSASAINIVAQTSLDTTRTFFLYSLWLTLYARVWTLSWDVMIYWTEVSVWTWGTWSMYWGCDLINTDKVIVVYWDWTTPVWNLATHKVCTIAWTTISQWTWATQSMVEWSWTAKTPLWVCKVRTDAYCLGYSSLNNQYYFISTVSWTTVTVNATEFFNPNQNQATWPIYLSDNFIGIAAFAPGSSNLIAYIYQVNSGSTAIANTFSTASFWNVPSPKIARISGTEYIITTNNTYVYRIPKPPSWTTITAVNILTAPGSALPVCAVWPNHFAIINGTTVSVYSRSWELIGTITWISWPVSNGLFQYMSMILWRWIYLNGTNWTSRIVNFAKVFYFWVANNTTGWVIKKWTITISWIIMNVKYYLQTDWTIDDIFTDRYIGIWIATNTLFVW